MDDPGRFETEGRGGNRPHLTAYIVAKKWKFCLYTVAIKATDQSA